MVQRVSSAQVAIEGQVVGSIGRGFLVLLGVGEADGPEQLERLWSTGSNELDIDFETEEKA